MKYSLICKNSEMKENQDLLFNPNILIDLVSIKMPYGKYKGRLICDIPEPYLVWYNQKGFPAGKIGVLLGTIYEIKLNGLEYLLKPLKNKIH